MSNVVLNQTCYETLQFDEPWTLESYRKIGGYSAWEEILKKKMPPGEIVETVKSSGLRGRGGAGGQFYVRGEHSLLEETGEGEEA